MRTIALTPFLNELLQEIRRQCEGETSHEEVLHLLAVLHDQILKSNVQTFQLLLPQDRRLKLIFEQLTDEPALSCSLKEWGGRKLGGRLSALYHGCSPRNSILHFCFGGNKFG